MHLQGLDPGNLHNRDISIADREALQNRFLFFREEIMTIDLQKC